MYWLIIKYYGPVPLKGNNEPVMAKYSEGRGGHFKGKPGTAAGILETHPVPLPRIRDPKPGKL